MSLQTPKSIIIAFRVIDLPEPYVKSIKYACSDCGEMCWVSYGTEEALLTGQVKKVVCTYCMEEILYDTSSSPQEGVEEGREV